MKTIIAKSRCHSEEAKATEESHVKPFMRSFASLRMTFACSTLLSIICALLFSNPSYAFTPETDCPAIATVSNMSDVVAALADDKFGINSPYLKEERYVICFNISLADGQIETSKILNIMGKDKPLVVYGLSLKPGEIVRGFYTGLFISVSGANITFQNLVIAPYTKQDKTQIIPTHALSLSGSNISILDSAINASQTGISIVGTAVQPAENIKINGTTITGQGVADSKGVYVENGKSVSLVGSDIIDNMGFGVYSKSGEGVNVTETTFKIADISKAIFWESGEKTVVDINLVGKTLDEIGEKVTRIAGVAPVQLCDINPSDNGKIDLYVGQKDYQAFTLEEIFKLEHTSSCPIQKIGSNEKLCFSSENCFGEGTCIFDCSTSIKSQLTVSFAYLNPSKDTLPLSIPQLTRDLNDLPIGTIELIASPGSTTVGGLTEGGSSTTDAVSNEEDAGSEEESESVAGDGSTSGSQVSGGGSDSGTDGTSIDSGGTAPLSDGIGSGLKSPVGCSLIIR